MARSFPIGGAPPPSVGGAGPSPANPLANPLAALASQPGGLANVIANLASAAQAQGQALDPNTLAALASLAGGQLPVQQQVQPQQPPQQQPGMSPYGAATGGYPPHQQAPPQGRYAYTSQPPPPLQQPLQQAPSLPTGAVGNPNNFAALLSSFGGGAGGVSPTGQMGGFSSAVPAYQQPAVSMTGPVTSLPSYTTMGYGKQQPQSQSQAPMPSNKTESVADILNRLKSLSDLQKR